MVLKAVNGSPFIHADGSIGIRRESIPLVIQLLAEPGFHRLAPSARTYPP